MLGHVQHGSNLCIADADRLAQRVGNLVSNAMAYGEPGTPFVATSTREDAFFSISVQNRDQPIPKDIMDGLFIVREIANAHSGTVSVTSTLEDGTVFTAVFPQGLAP